MREKRADTDSEVNVEERQGWQDLGVASATATFAILGKDNQTLVVTTVQRSALEHKIESAFGKKLKPKENRILELTANELLKFLKDKWKSAKAAN